MRVYVVTYSKDIMSGGGRAVFDYLCSIRNGCKSKEVVLLSLSGPSHLCSSANDAGFRVINLRLYVNRSLFAHLCKFIWLCVKGKSVFISNDERSSIVCCISYILQ